MQPDTWTLTACSLTPNRTNRTMANRTMANRTRKQTILDSGGTRSS